MPIFINDIEKHVKSELSKTDPTYSQTETKQNHEIKNKVHYRTLLSISASNITEITWWTAHINLTKYPQISNLLIFCLKNKTESGSFSWFRPSSKYSKTLIT